MWPNPQFPADLVTFTEEILKKKLHFLCSGSHDWMFIETISEVSLIIVQITCLDVAGKFIRNKKEPLAFLWYQVTSNNEEEPAVTLQS